MEANIDTITVNGKTYYSQKPQAETISGNLKIVVLQRGWVLIGRLIEVEGSSRFRLTNAQVIRSWGTTQGLGELALKGKQVNTKLDPTNGEVEFDALTMVLSISAKESVWPGL